MRFLKSPNIIGWLPLCCALLCVGVLGAFRDNHYGGDISWAGNYQIGAQTARKTHRPMLLCFHTPGCGWCEKLDAETFTDPKVVELSSRYICVRLESDVDAQIVQKYGITQYPTVLLTDPEGRLLHEITGYVPPPRFAESLR